MSASMARLHCTHPLRSTGQHRVAIRAPSIRRYNPTMSWGGPAPGSGLSPELKKAIDSFVADNKVVVFIKGTKQFPQCGFSNTVVQILNTTARPYEAVNILEDERLRSGMKEYSQWPTFPQVYIDGEFYGGCDILLESYNSGELQEVMERTFAS